MNEPIQLAPVVPIETSIEKIMRQGAKPKTPPKPTYPLLQVNLAKVAARYCDEILTPEIVSKIEAALDLVAVEQQVIENHNVPRSAAKVTEANRAYAANPTKENLRLLREAKSLDLWEHGRIQLAAISRQKKIILSELSPLMPPIYTKTANLLDAEGHLLESLDGENYKNFSMPVPVHPLAQSLHCAATAFRVQATHAAGSTELPEFLNCLLAAWRDPLRVRPILTALKIFMPRQEAEAAPVESAPVGEPGVTEAVEAT